jgi:hypothetical protein
MSLDTPTTSVHGPCNCEFCALKTSVTIPQVQFRKNRKEGFVETLDIRKQYQLVLNKRWLCVRHNDIDLPYDLMTLPFGYKM